MSLCDRLDGRNARQLIADGDKPSDARRASAIEDRVEIGGEGLAVKIDVSVEEHDV
jgi:hypothetical protein